MPILFSGLERNRMNQTAESPLLQNLRSHEEGRQTNKQIKRAYFTSSKMPWVVRCPIISCASKKEKGLPIKL